MLRTCAGCHNHNSACISGLRQGGRWTTNGRNFGLGPWASTGRIFGRVSINNPQGPRHGHSSNSNSVDVCSSASSASEARAAMCPRHVVHPCRWVRNAARVSRCRSAMLRATLTVIHFDWALLGASEACAARVEALVRRSPSWLLAGDPARGVPALALATRTGLGPSRWLIDIRSGRCACAALRPLPQQQQQC